MKIRNLLFLPLVLGCLVSCGGTKKEDTPLIRTITYKTGHNVDDKVKYSKEDTFTLDLSSFVLENNEVYQNEMAEFNVLLSADACKGETSIYVKQEDGSFYNDGTSLSLLNELNFSDVTFISLKSEDYQHDRCDLEDMIFAHIDFTYDNKNYQLFVFNFLGCKTMIHYRSCLDLGHDDESYMSDLHPHAEWDDTSYHKGIYVGEERSYQKALDYFNHHKKNGYTQILDLTGHSRGAGIVNIFSQKLYDSYVNSNKQVPYKIFAYGFASPGVSKIQRINKVPFLFNVLNKSDAIIYFPGESLGFFRCGTEIKGDAADFENQFNDYYDGAYTYSDLDAEALEEALFALLKHKDEMYVNFDVTGDAIYLNKDNAKEEYAIMAEVVKVINLNYNYCIELSEPEDQLIGAKIHYAYSRSFILNLILYVMDNDLDFVSVIPFIRILGDIIPTVILYLPRLLLNGTEPFQVNHLLCSYYIIVKNTHKY